MKPMRMLVLLAVFWAAGSLLLAAESPSTTPKPAAAANKTADEPAKAEPKAEQKTEPKSADESKPESKTEPGKGSIAEQAEAALKAAAEADPGAAPGEPANSGEDTDPQAKDDTQRPPTGSSGRGPSPQRFTPTEQVRADFDVSFPIDI